MKKTALFLLTFFVVVGVLGCSPRVASVRSVNNLPTRQHWHGEIRVMRESNDIVFRFYDERSGELSWQLRYYSERHRVSEGCYVRLNLYSEEEGDDTVCLDENYYVLSFSDNLREYFEGELERYHLHGLNPVVRELVEDFCDLYLSFIGFNIEHIAELMRQMEDW